MKPMKSRSMIGTSNCPPAGSAARAFGITASSFNISLICSSVIMGKLKAYSCKASSSPCSSPVCAAVPRINALSASVGTRESYAYSRGPLSVPQPATDGETIRYQATSESRWMRFFPSRERAMLARLLNEQSRIGGTKGIDQYGATFRHFYPRAP